MMRETVDAPPFAAETAMDEGQPGRVVFFLNRSQPLVIQHGARIKHKKFAGQDPKCRFFGMKFFINGLK